MQTFEAKTVTDMLSILEKLQFQFGCSPKGSGFLFRGNQDVLYSLLPGIYRSFSEKQNERLADGSIEGKVYQANENEILAVH